MISAVLAFIHGRKWVVELILAAALAGGIWWFCAHLIDVGVQRERAAWIKKVDAANLEAAHQKGLADAAEATGKREHDELETYVAAHPLHGSFASLCRPTTSLPSANPAIPGNAAASTAAADFLALPEGDHSGDAVEPDQFGLLDLLAQRADGVSAQLREYQARK